MRVMNDGIGEASRDDVSSMYCGVATDVIPTPCNEASYKLVLNLELILIHTDTINVLQV